MPAARADERHRAAEARVFQPASDPWGILTVEGGQVARSLQWGFGLWATVEDAPMSLPLGPETPARAVPVVDHRLALHLQAFLGLFDWIQVGLDLALLRQELGSAFDPEDPWGFVASDPQSNTRRWSPSVVAGDARLLVKVRLFRGRGLHVAALLAGILPLGDETVFAGERGWAGEGRLAAGYGWKFLRVAANVGYLLRPPARILDPVAWRTDGERRVMLELNDELIWGLGSRFSITRWLDLSVELHGRVPLLAKGPRDMPMEALAGLHLRVGRSVELAAGGGAGLGRYLPADMEHLGRSPSWRAFLGVRYAPTEHGPAAALGDRDGDGIPDHLDECPDEPEDFDGFQDEDGCPDPDNDQDGIPDHLDKCPDEAEDFDGFEDEDGCPELDNDGDGIPDVRDRCPGVDADKRDDFKMVKEDIDGFEDDDGCPDFDNDGDGIPDHLDQCPNEPEDFNGVDDEDGCPDGEGGTIIAGGKIDLAGQRIMFTPGKAEIMKVSHALLDKVANTLRNNPGVTVVRIEGHTDDVGDPARNQRLSEERAVAVLEYLVTRGVLRTRMAAVGYGHTRPKVPNTDAKSRAENRRVEFIVVNSP